MFNDEHPMGTKEVELSGIVRKWVGEKNPNEVSNLFMYSVTGLAYDALPMFTSDIIALLVDEPVLVHHHVETECTTPLMAIKAVLVDYFCDVMQEEFDLIVQEWEDDHADE